MATRWLTWALAFVVIAGCKKKPKQEDPEPTSGKPATGHSVTHKKGGDDEGGGKALEGVTSISVGGQHACAVVDSKLYCWDGASGQAEAKTDAPGPVEAVSNGACALIDDGSVWCWPHRVQLDAGGRTGAGQVAASDSDVCASRQLFVWCWKPDDDAPRTQFDWVGMDRLVVGAGRACSVVGGNEIECHDVAAKQGDRAEQVHDVQDVSMLAMASNTTCAVHTQGTVDCWNDPHQKLAIAGVTSASAVALGADGDACAITSGGVMCWKLALAGPSLERPAAAVEGANATTISVGSGFACALGTDKKVRCWSTDGGKPQVINKG